jgi:hypothetical protein
MVALSAAGTWLSDILAELEEANENESVTTAETAIIMIMRVFIDLCL